MLQNIKNISKLVGQQMTLLIHTTTRAKNALKNQFFPDIMTIKERE